MINCRQCAYQCLCLSISSVHHLGNLIGWSQVDGAEPLNTKRMQSCSISPSSNWHPVRLPVEPPLRRDTHAAVVFGASLSEPHTSVTSLHTCVCMFACLDRPLIVSHFRLLFCAVTLYVKFKNYLIVEDMKLINHGKSSSSMATTRTETPLKDLFSV